MRRQIDGIPSMECEGLDWLTSAISRTISGNALTGMVTENKNEVKN